MKRATEDREWVFGCDTSSTMSLEQRYNAAEHGLSVQVSGEIRGRTILRLVSRLTRTTRPRDRARIQRQLANI